jgi:hypothetical protein
MDEKWAVPSLKAAEYLPKLGVEFDNFTMDCADPQALTGPRITFYTPDAAVRFTETDAVYSTSKDAKGKFVNLKPLPADKPKDWPGGKPKKS